MSKNRFYAVSFKRRDGTRAVMATRDKLGRERRYFIKHCIQCGGVYYASRKDAMTCSGTCRQALYRARKRAARIQHLQKVLQHKDRLEQKDMFKNG